MVANWCCWQPGISNPFLIIWLDIATWFFLKKKFLGSSKTSIYLFYVLLCFFSSLKNSWELQRWFTAVLLKLVRCCFSSTTTPYHHHHRYLNKRQINPFGKNRREKRSCFLSSCLHLGERPPWQCFFGSEAKSPSFQTNTWNFHTL